jgi:hypothetical protein
MHPKLGWLEELKTMLSGAMGTNLGIQVEDHVDPLKKIVKLTFQGELGKGNYMPIANLCHGFAKANDCAIGKITRSRGCLTLEILVKTRHGPVMQKNPLR